MRSELERDFERFKRELPRDFPDHVRAAYGVDLTARYLGETVPHPIGKGSGQLSLNGGQLEDDAAAGLAFVGLKTVIAEDEAGAQAMAPWAVPQSREEGARPGAWARGAGVAPASGGVGWGRPLGRNTCLV